MDNEGQAVAVDADEQDRSDILDNYRAQLRAMLDGDTERLGDLLTEDFTLTHMTGLLQPKEEWLAQMQAGQFDYHDALERNVSLHVDGDTARLVGRIVTDATVYGARANWPLQLTMDLIRVNGRWLASRSVATMW
ncbi:nuclear transport factor 2 family protein [Arthrobacter sp. ISL-28]|uniref:nuclear transport factor 2 family protein n=1 Tax=Arthrobacter sp. ISL-28 TaxID=2819108 RepID=UPI001BE9FEF0|nr:nuclear transport factor 2 family protein [Arthrobacter sp. ISL-28]MBT2519433.1 nuclear transport factor 2 family protein [Arthrobacter sp. ISL-28]